MKLVNKTTLPDEVLRVILVKAGRAVRARTSRVVVMVTQGRALGRCSGLAESASRVHLFDGPRHMRHLDTDCGWFKIVLPAVRWSAGGDDWGDPLRSAEAFYRCARHEWNHVREYQLGGVWAFEFSGRNGERRPPWCQRPEEQRAEAACDDADALGRSAEWAYEEVVVLALALEEKALENKAAVERRACRG